MNLEELKKYQDAAKKATVEKDLAIQEYLNANGIPIGTKVKLPNGKVGIVSKKEYVSHRKDRIGHTINKITKSGNMHKTASIAWYRDSNELEVIE